MKWKPPAEGEFVCNHLALNVVDLILVLTKHKKFYKTGITALGKNSHNDSLLYYFSCKKCFDKISSKTKPSQSAVHYEIESSQGDDKYKITGTIMNHSQGRVVYKSIISGTFNYITIRSMINGGVIGSGYEFHREEAFKLWVQACALAFSDYIQTSLTWEEWKQKQNSTNTAGKSRITRLAKVKLGKIVDKMTFQGMTQDAFDEYRFYDAKKRCDFCGVAFTGRGPGCRFCRLLSDTELWKLEQKEKKIKKRLYKLQNADKKEIISNRVEIESKAVLVSEMVEEKGHAETFSELKEVYGRTEAREMLGISDNEEGLSEGERNEM